MSRGRDGFTGIENYAAIGDCRSIALVATDGRIDWWPVIDADSPPGFAALIDPEAGGYLELAPTVPYQSRRRYLPHTNVLETTFVTDVGTVRVLDLIPFGRNGNLAWSELVRRVEGQGGSVPMAWRIVPGTQFRQVAPRVIDDPDGPMIEIGDELLAVRAFDVGEPTISQNSVEASFVTSPGSDSVLAIVASRESPVFLAQREEVEGHVDLTVGRWEDWADSVSYDGPWADAVLRSTLALKLLTSIQTGAILAAPTTSLPERVGGAKNWDYRFMWVRDAAFTIDAFLSLGLHAEAQASVQWLLAAVRRTSPTLQTLYRVSGETPDPEVILPLPGYRDSRPVRWGNSAVDQLQLGNFGDLLDAVAQYVAHGHRLDRTSASALADLVDRCCTQWMVEDCGIWELQSKHHYTISKVGCWVALDRAVRLADAGQLNPESTGRWREVRDEIKSWVDEHCFSTRRNAYTWFAGTEDLDAATLLVGRTGFDVGDRLAGTIEAIEAELSSGAALYRYTGVADEEGAFVACSFWLVQAYVSLGQLDAAADRMERALALANDLGLMAEQVDPASGMLLGNFPQGLSHLALVNAACAYTRATKARPR
jgi:GH15 family glucan-1,4-alpha-glucosidase